MKNDIAILNEAVKAELTNTKNETTAGDLGRFNNVGCFQSDDDASKSLIAHISPANLLLRSVVGLLPEKGLIRHIIRLKEKSGIIISIKFFLK